VLKGVEDGRYDCGYDDILYVPDAQPFIVEQLIDDHSVFVGTLVVICFQTPVLDQFSIPEYSQYNVCVSYIKC
jgi:hypothetical protein